MKTDISIINSLMSTNNRITTPLLKKDRLVHKMEIGKTLKNKHTYYKRLRKRKKGNRTPMHSADKYQNDSSNFIKTTRSLKRYLHEYSFVCIKSNTNQL